MGKTRVGNETVSTPANAQHGRQAGEGASGELALPTRISIEGELSIYTAGAVREQFIAALAAGGAVEVDLSAVSEMDSAGMQLMVAAKREAAARSQLLRFTAHSPAVLRILDLCDLAGHLGDPLLIHAAPRQEKP